MKDFKIDQNKIPKHVAIIMDGNGRWAKIMGKNRSFGHQKGIYSVKKIYIIYINPVSAS